MEQLYTFVTSEWVYWVILVLAIAEASVISSFLLSGTIGFVVIGALIQQGLLDPVLSLGAVYIGTVIGDVSTFLIATRLRSVRHIAAALERFAALREPLAAAPARFIAVGHFVPYLRAMLPVLAAGKVTPRKYILIEAISALGSSAGFIGLGYFGADLLRLFPAANALTTVSVLAFFLLVAMWIWVRKPFCPLKPRDLRWLNIRRAVIFCLFYLPWHPVRWLEIWFHGMPSRRLRRALAAALPGIRKGDILLIRLHAPAPWGRWAHTAMAIDDAGRFAHGFSKVVTEHAITGLPVRYAIAHMRPNCDEKLACRAAEIARSKIGAPVAVTARRDETDRFSCASLVLFAFQSVGVELVDQGIARVVPDDLFTSPRMTLLRIVETEQVSSLTNRYIFAARKGDRHD